MRDTSIMAYRSILKDLPKRQGEVYSGIAKIKKGTFRDIAIAAGVPESTAWKRLSELERKGLVRGDKRVKSKVSGKLVTLWEITDNE